MSPDTAGASDLVGSEVVVMAAFDILASSRLWGWSRLVRGQSGLRGASGLRFAKVLGSGVEGGFGLKPSASILGLFCVFQDAASAEAFTSDDGLMRRWQHRSRESFCVKMRVYSCRGSWAGSRLAVTATTPVAGPVVSLTRASIKPSRAAAFWQMQPPAERSLEQATGCRLAIGVGEAPLLRQATFTVWDDVAAMDRYARSGAHQEAIVAAARGGFFSESMFVRFAPYEIQGEWKGLSIA
jgi:spheroidene monooxygenase